ncbi:MAG: preprotein translocase subunit SecY [Clostridia bacterium]|nr:preprotein translocase subunit SecY [Clostridia bacterium]
MFKTLKNAWRIPELKKKLLFTLLIVVLYRLGANIPVPYVDPNTFSQAAEIFSGTILQYLNILSGEALGKATLLALGVSPYITASIVMQLLTIAIPPLERLSKDGENGRKKITAITRFVTVALALVTSIGYALFLSNNDLLVVEPNFFQYAIIVACYCAGAALVMWLAEKINDHGIGNGISIILFANIIAGFYSMFQSIWDLATNDNLHLAVGILLAVLEVAVLIGMVMLIVWMSDAERRIPIQYAKRVVGRKMYGGQNTNLPIKVNMSGVMPIIFANSIVAIPATIASFISNQENGFVKFVNNVFNYNTWPYLIVFLVLLIAFAYFYVAISFNPIEVANNIKNNGGAVPGIRSGRPTVDYIKKILNRITLVGALLVAFIACFPMIVNIVTSYFEATQGLFMALAFSGSSMMIVVGVALETTRELEAQMSLRNYKGFLD